MSTKATKNGQATSKETNPQQAVAILFNVARQAPLAAEGHERLREIAAGLMEWVEERLPGGKGKKNGSTRNSTNKQRSSSSDSQGANPGSN